DYVFAWENANMVCNAVLKFPKNTEMLDQLYKNCVQMDPETWYPGGLIPIFTDYLRKFNLINKALSSEYFYPIYCWNREGIQQQSSSEDRTYIVHLFQQIESVRELNLLKQIDVLNNSLSLRIGRSIPFGTIIRKLIDKHE